MSQLQQQAIYPGAELFLLKQFMRREGIVPAQALLGTGLDEAQLSRAGSLVSSEQFDRIYRNLYRLAARADFGLALGQALNLSRWGLLSAALFSSKTLGDALATANQLRVLLRSRFTLTAAMREGGYDIEVRKREGMEYPLNSVFAHEMLFTSLQVQIAQLLGREFYFTEIRLNYPPPPHAADYERYFAAKVQFNSPVSGFCIDRDTMHQPLPLANPAAKQQAMLVAEAELKRVLQVQKGDIGWQVRALIQGSEQRLALDDVAAGLNLSPRTLRRKLQEAGLTFRQISDEELLKKSMLLLDDQQQKVSSVASACGFKDLLSFREAFKRWSGMTPQQYRRR
ncbi:AraC family transcriptional regulator [Thalassolituus sp. C2-1]|uniref:AraC family transcriptional regulator n=1 Tax=Venatorbacter sp. C2-1 TaxID=2597518 RepID=UPI0016441BEF|nr:AraC family transcriptional regulator [Thalassolituus sp. C2-1]